MVSTDLFRAFTQPVTGLVCLTGLIFTCPPTWAAPSGSVPPLVPSTGQFGPIPSTSQFGPASLDYLLGAGDRIRVTVLEVPEYSGEYQVPPGGILYIPLIGSVSVQGLTQSQAADTISAKYARYLKRPLVTVSLTAARPVNIVVAGEVNGPGAFTVNSGGGTQLPTVVSAITLAQGVTLAADITQVQIRRQSALGTPPQYFTVNLKNLIQVGTQPSDLTLRDGDTVFVPTITNTNVGDPRSFATANFAAPPNLPRTVTIVGEVNRPGPYVIVGGATSGTTQLSPGGTISQGAGGTVGLPTVSRALQIAGGITSTADLRHVQIRRATKIGPAQIINVDLMQLITTGDITQDALLQEGDSIIVPRSTNLTAAEETQIASTNLSPDTIQVSIIGEVRNPGVLRIPPNTPLNQALLNAGGFNNGRANRRAVDLIRLNLNGTVTKRLVKIDLASNLNERNNPTLRNNDIILVSRNGLAKTSDTLSTIFQPFNSLLSVFGLVNTFK